ncbi:B-cell receptor CD22-like [Channa argus]|uniref:B-cell receptor CD22-like n=1 Tax=Channa argus TaxID=215402 RepID=UPI0035205457
MSASVSFLGFAFLSLLVVQAHNRWGVTYPATHICAIKGSTVEIYCSYTFSSKKKLAKGYYWFTESSGDEPVPLKLDEHYRARVNYQCDILKSCTLTIKDLQLNDSAVYKFRFISGYYDEKYTGEPGVTLSVTDPHLQVKSYFNSRLECSSSCSLPVPSSFVWYKNGQEINAQTSDSYSGHFGPADSFSCALWKHKEFPSPPVCGKDQSCNRVIYNVREICAFKDSSVDISCTYNSFKEPVESKFWFSPEHSRQWQNPSQPEDLSKDSQYSGRVQVFETETGRSTLRITDLRETDSAHYHFKFITQNFEWRSSLPGTTLTVTDIQMQVVETSQELRLNCQTRCHILDGSYIWYKNGEKINGKRSSSYSISYDNQHSYSCAVKGLEDFPSHSACVRGQFCNRVTYTHRRICVCKGSSVDISCTYNGYNYVTSKFWFSPERSRQWQNPSQPEDLSKDSQYSGRVQVFETETRRSTLRITNLRETDSAHYHFKFITRGFEWRSSLPGTTLTVTALQVQVIKVIIRETYTEAELKCHSSCSPFAFVWLKNGKKISLEDIYYKGQLYPGDEVSCAFKGHEGLRSPSVYAPKVILALVSASAEVLEGGSVNLTCSTDANPPANYTWYKENHGLLSTKHHLAFSSIQSSDSGQYYCTAENELGRRRSEYVFINVKS